EYYCCAYAGSYIVLF
nr:immunoglobulin light chain junction region [Macaca mulatta]MOV96188.1 immunoglobulin light chain junction region [Macaca mulatta]